MIRPARWLRWLFGATAATAWKGSNRDRFTTLFKSGRWVSVESASGPGSDRGSPSVVHAVAALETVTRDFSIRSIADVPCGDFNWMGLFLDDHPGIDYVGYDIVEDLIAQNRARHPGRRFEVLDITRETPPAADLVFSKDLVNHLFERDVWAALGHMAASGSRYLMLTTNAGHPNNELELLTPRSSRHLDLAAAPYLLPPPVHADGYLWMWRTDDVAARLAARAEMAPRQALPVTGAF